MKWRNIVRRMALWTTLPSYAGKVAKPGQKPKRVRKRKKMTSLLDQYAKRRPIWLRLKGRCDRCFARDTQRRLQVHHIRGRLGQLLVDERFWACLCNKCHQWVHANPDAARKAGLLAERGQWNRMPLPPVTTSQTPGAWSYASSTRLPPLTGVPGSALPVA